MIHLCNFRFKAFYFFILLVPIYIFGYLTVQLASGADDPAVVRLLSQARQDLQATKLDRAVAGFDPASKQTYEAFDVVGLIALEIKMRRGDNARPEEEEIVLIGAVNLHPVDEIVALLAGIERIAHHDQ